MVIIIGAKTHKTFIRYLLIAWKRVYIPGLKLSDAFISAVSPLTHYTLYSFFFWTYNYKFFIKVEKRTNSDRF